MGFLDKLQDIGFGNRGPYGRQQSGAQALSQTIDTELGEHRQGGFNKALIAATQGPKGELKQIEAKELVQFADMWKIPLDEAVKLMEQINKPIQTQQDKNYTKSLAVAYVTFAKENPGKVLDQKGMISMMDKAGARGAEHYMMGMGVLQRLVESKEQGTLTKMGPEDRLSLTLNGKSSIIQEAATTKETPAQKRAADLALFKKKKDYEKQLGGGKGGSKLPEGYNESLINAFEAIDGGADPDAVYKKMRVAFPQQADKLHTIIVKTAGLSLDAKKDLQESAAKIVAGSATAKDEARRLSAKYSDKKGYAIIIRRTLLTGGSDEAIMALAELFGK